MKCKYREILRRGQKETARMFSVCTHPDLLKQFDSEWIKLRCSLICEDCLFREEV